MFRDDHAGLCLVCQVRALQANAQGADKQLQTLDLSQRYSVWIEMRATHENSKAGPTARSHREGISGVTPTTGTDSVHIPLAVDLDGTLFRTNLLLECVFRLAKQKPWLIPLLPLWLLQGKAFLKKRAFEAVTLDCSLFPIDQRLVDWLREQKAQGRHLTLATAANEELAIQAVAHLELFDTIIGSDEKRNLKGPVKAAALRQMYESGFAYAGNSSADLAIWKHSAEAIVVNANDGVRSQAERLTTVTKIFENSGNNFGSIVRSLRPYQWVKNLLVFVPAFTSHEGVRWPILVHSLIAFIAFSLCASGSYIFNDLLDLEEDRAHVTKKTRPFASGDISIFLGISIASVLFVSGIGVAFTAGRAFPALLLLYMTMAAAYSMRIKRVLLLDVLTLAILYTMRVIAGHVVTGIAFSVWLLSFAFFLFLSLAFCKRATELFKLNKRQDAGTDREIPGRGYRSEDLQIISAAGLSSGFLASLVFALYINSESVTLLYRRPAFLWGILPLLLYYILRIWIVCGRGELDDDPILYTAKSPSTYFIAILVMLIVVAATINF
jgi:4-hydroxybenzoate polyprenyltransferase